ncbi:uncharacterized protein KQ657_001143 [Scheffersomyces spartinae]|uniref:Thioredoxin domain-containing protein n=1 Tax=Scheffersomyces spartinae TaxID=45513 RepID=A0A9P7V890_9ASCO|nr:uncharacterized protein KQ657_001143 [Scheffersomyces spartinae]KAG7193028.1 hypothetical protein KQ657_001143 [Scheffersomyces spartinae]
MRLAATIWGASIEKDNGAQVANINEDGLNKQKGAPDSEEKKSTKGKENVQAKLNKEVSKNNKVKVKGETSDKSKGKSEKDDDEEKDKSEEKDQTVSDIKIPPMLTMDTFDKEVGKTLTLVEFFSPLCSHCKHFAPTWEKIYREFKPEMERLQIDMRQVDCVVSGDLCNREQVMAYPDLRLYHSNPNADVKSSAEDDKDRNNKKKKKKESTSKHLATFPKGRLRTEENIKKFLRNSASEYNDGIDIMSSSKMLNTDELLHIASGAIDEPYFVAFFPCTEKEWKDTDKTGKSMFSRNCLECGSSKLIWDKLSNKVPMKTGHFSCLTNPNACISFDLASSTYSDNESTPKYMMFLPKKVAHVGKIDYKKPIATFKGLKLFAEKIYSNYHYRLSSGETLRRDKTVVTELSDPIEYEYPLENKISLVYYHDQTIVEEDKSLLPYILEYIADSPFNFDLRICKFDNVEKLLNEQNHAIVNYANLLQKDEAKKIEYDEKMNIMTGYTTKPTLLMFHENSLINHVFHSYAPEDIRSFKKVKKFLDLNKFPLHQELTPALIPQYFNPKAKKQDDLQGKVVVVFLDTKDEKQTNDALSKIALAAHSYHLSHQKYYYDEVLEGRKLKIEKTKKLKLKKQKGDNSVDVVSAMKEEVPHNFDLNRVLFVFIDLSSDVFAEEGSIWNIDNKQYAKGDAVILSNDNKYMWETDLNGTRLRNDPERVTEVLLSLLDPNLANGRKAAWRLVGSPFNNSVPFMNYIHMHGFLGYLGLFIALWSCLSLLRGSRRRRRSRHNGNSSLVRQGIIGNHINSPKKD